jgi:hypothetical protein
MILLLLLTLLLLIGCLVLHRLWIVFVFLVFELFVVFFLIVLTIVAAFFISLVLHCATAVLTHALLSPEVVSGTASHLLFVLLIGRHVLNIVGGVVEVHVALGESELLLVLIAAIIRGLDNLPIDVD